MRDAKKLLSSVGVIAAVLVLGSALPAPAHIGEVATEPTTLVVRYTKSAAPADVNQALAAVGARQLGSIGALRLMRVEVAASSVPILRAQSVVEWAYRPSVAHVMGGRPNDPLLNRQWALTTMDVFRGWQHEDGTGSPVTVAVVDSGIDPSHPDLQGALVKGLDLINDDDDPADDHGHGTHVAGVIAARSNNRKGIAGLSWGAKVMPLKACRFDGSCDEYSVTAAIVYAVQQGAKVINLSLGGPADGCPPAYDLARRFAEQRGVALVAAAGNGGNKEAGNPMMYPAGCDGYIGVGATSPFDEWAPFSEHNSSVDLSAPGMGVLSTIPPALGGMEDDPASPGYGLADGTSMAAPQVSGLAALLFAAHPGWTAAQVEQRMSTTAIDLGERGRDDYFGEGRINVGRALSGGR